MTTPDIEKLDEDLRSDGQKLVLSDLLNRVLDKGMVLSGNITIAVADIDLIQLDLRLLLSAVETAIQRVLPDGDNPPLLPDSDREPE